MPAICARVLVEDQRHPQRRQIRKVGKQVDRHEAKNMPRESELLAECEPAVQREAYDAAHQVSAEVGGDRTGVEEVHHAHDDSEPDERVQYPDRYKFEELQESPAELTPGGQHVLRSQRRPAQQAFQRPQRRQRVRERISGTRCAGFASPPPVLSRRACGPSPGARWRRTGRCSPRGRVSGLRGLCSKMKKRPPGRVTRQLFEPEPVPAVRDMVEHAGRETHVEIAVRQVEARILPHHDDTFGAGNRSAAIARERCEASAQDSSLSGKYLRKYGIEFPIPAPKSGSGQPATPPPPASAPHRQSYGEESGFSPDREMFLAC